MVLLLDLAPAVLFALQFPSDRPEWGYGSSRLVPSWKLEIHLVNLVESILSSGQYVGYNSHSLLAVGKLADVAL